MNMTGWTFGIVEIIWAAGMLMCAVGPLVLLLLISKWLYESKKSLAEILATLKGIKADAAAGKSSTECEHE